MLELKARLFTGTEACRESEDYYIYDTSLFNKRTTLNKVSFTAAMAKVLDQEIYAYQDAYIVMYITSFIPCV